MRPLAKLPPGFFYVGSDGGRSLMDDRGHWFTVERQAVPVALPAAEPPPPPAPLPDPSLSAQALRYIAAEEAFLQAQPTEHFAALHISESGDVVGATRFDTGCANEILVDVSRVLREAEACDAAGTFVFHNHPAGSSKASPADKRLTTTLQECLHRRGIRLLGSHIVPGRPQPIREAATPRVETDWHVRQAAWERQPAWFQRLMARASR